MSTRPEETEAHSLDGLGGLGREEREGVLISSVPKYFWGTSDEAAVVG